MLYRREASTVSSSGSECRYTTQEEIENFKQTKAEEYIPCENTTTGNGFLTPQRMIAKDCLWLPRIQDCCLADHPTDRTLP